MKTVLLIDDDRVFRTALNRWLTDEGWKVLEADDGEKGLVLARDHQPKAIVLDLLMPRLNGYQFLRRLRSQPFSYGAPRVIVTSGCAYPADQAAALEAGADGFLAKPVRPHQIATALSGDDSMDAKGLSDGLGQSEAARIDRSMLVRFWGVRGSIATPGPSTVHYGGNTSCVEVRAGGEIIILDAGTGIRPLGMSLISEFQQKPIKLTVLITHTHWDHIQGFPFFIPAYNPSNRVEILGFDGARKGLERTLSSQMESPYFPISMRQMPGNISIQELRDMEFEIGEVQIKASFVNHPGVCVGYRLNTKAGSVGYLPDNELRPAKGDKPAAGENDSQSLGGPVSSEELAEFLADVDILIIDSQYDASEYSTHVGWGHSCVDDTVRLAMRARAKRMFLFHHDPSHDDAQITRMVEYSRELAAAEGSNLIIEAAREGTEIVLGGGGESSSPVKVTEPESFPQSRPS